MDINVRELLEKENYYIVLDTNVYLGMYRCSPDFSAFALNCLESVRSYVRIPYTVKIEFYKHCKSAYAKRNNMMKDVWGSTKKSVETQEKAMINALSNMLKAHFPDSDSLIEEIREKYNDIQDLIEEYMDEHAVLEILSNGWDEDKVENIFNSMIESGGLMDDFHRDEIYRICEEGFKRYKENVPPGFMDASNKDGIRKYSDLILWKEVLRFAHDNQCNIIFVTDDVKRDWWDTTTNKYVFHNKLLEEFEKESSLRKKENNGERGEAKKILPLVSKDFYELISCAYDIEKTEAIDQVLEMTCDDYISEVAEEIWNKVWLEFQYSDTKYVDLDLYESRGSFGVSEWELVDYELQDYRILEKSGDEIEYQLIFYVTFEGTSFEYAGKNGRTILSVPAYSHTFEGKIEVIVLRICDEYTDLSYDCSFEDAYIIDTDFEEKECTPVFDLDIEDEEDEEDGFWGEKYTECPDCGKKISHKNDGGNGFCIDCAINH